MRLSLYKAAALLPLLFVSCAQIPSDQTVSRDLDRFGLNCPVRSINVRSSANELDYKALFDADGRLVKIENRFVDGGYAGDEQYFYDDTGNLSEIRFFSSDRVMEGRKVFRYDSTGSRISEAYYGNNNDEQYQCEFMQESDSVEVLRFTREQAPVMTLRRFRDGLFHRETSFDPEGNLMDVASVEYFSEGKMSHMENSSNEMSVEYTDAGLPVRSVNCVVDTRGAYQWEDGLVDQPVRCYEYKFDRRGNWIHRVEFAGDDARVTVDRRIRYR